MSDAVIEYMNLALQAKVIKEKMAILKPFVEELVEDEFVHEDMVIKKTFKRYKKLKEGVSITDIMDKCPEAIKYEADLNRLANNTQWHEFVEFEKKSAISVSLL